MATFNSYRNRQISTLPHKIETRKTIGKESGSNWWIASLVYYVKSNGKFKWKRTKKNKAMSMMTVKVVQVQKAAKGRSVIKLQI